MHEAQRAQKMHCLYLYRTVLLSFSDGKIYGGVSFFSRTDGIFHFVGDCLTMEDGSVDACLEGFCVDASGGQNSGRSAVGITQNSKHQMVGSDLRAACSHRLFTGEGKNVAKILGKLHIYCHKSS